MDHVRPRLQILAAAILMFLCAACGGRSATDANGTSGASCVAPYLDGQPPGDPIRGAVPTVGPGATITIYGHWYTSTCNDSGGDDPLRPLPPVHLTLSLPGGDAQQLGEFHPSGEDMGFSVGVRVPAEAMSGTATVRDDQQYPATFSFRVGR